MAEKTQLNLPDAVFREMASWAEKAYPHEGCGLLIGRFQASGDKDVIRFAPLTNELLTRTVSDASTLPAERQGQGAGKTEFVMNPDQFNQETLKAEKENLDVIGVVHTHPDHPPRPSQIDESQPFLAQWSNVIVAVEKGRFQEMKSWFRATDEEPFNEEPINKT